MKLPVGDHPCVQFLSTPSAWRATRGRQDDLRSLHTRIDFYPRPPHGGRRCDYDGLLPQRFFLPTPSAWRATNRTVNLLDYQGLSTHALRMEGDKAVLYRIHDGILSTHALRMEGDAITIALNQIFSLSTHALTWRATGSQAILFVQFALSTHALTWRATGLAGE